MVKLIFVLRYLPFVLILDLSILNIMQVIPWKGPSKINFFLKVFFCWWAICWWEIQDLLGESLSDLWITLLPCCLYLFVKLSQLLLYFASQKSYHSRYVSLDVKIRNLKVDFKTGGTWRQVRQWTLMMKIYDLFHSAKSLSSNK